MPIDVDMKIVKIKAYQISPYSITLHIICQSSERLSSIVKQIQQHWIFWENGRFSLSCLGIFTKQTTTFD